MVAYGEKEVEVDREPAKSIIEPENMARVIEEPTLSNLLSSLNV